MINPFIPLNLSSLLILGVGLLFLIFAAQIIYNLYFHPLADYPGPKSWAACRLTFVYSMINGTFIQDLQRIHQRYGDTVRIAPDELSFARPQAWHDIFERPDHITFPKDPIWYKLPDGRQDPSLAMTTNIADHARMRKLMENGFTYKALKAQESIIQSYVTMLMTRLREKTTAGGTDGGVVDMVDWFNFTTFDIVGDLGFGESFDCLKDSSYHPWVAMLFKCFKALIVFAMARYYPTLENILMKLMPQSLLNIQRDHYQMAVEKIHRRLNLETTRKDFVTPLIEDNKDMQFMSMAEIEATLSIIITAGSETSATALSGITNSLVQDPQTLHKLVKELRGTFENENDITMTAVKDLRYLNACISEGLRTSSPVPGGMPRLVPRGGAIVCGRHLPENTRVSVALYTLSYSPEHFSNPERFYPERWLPAAAKSEIAITRHNPAALRPFGAGSRRCIGKEMAWAEMQLILARLVWNFDLSMADPENPVDWKRLKTWAVVQKEPIMVRLRERERGVTGERADDGDEGEGR